LIHPLAAKGPMPDLLTDPMAVAKPVVEYGPSLRMLLVLQTVAAHAQIQYGDLLGQTGLTRGTLARALANLQDIHLIQTVPPTGYSIVPHLVSVAGKANAAEAVLAPLEPLIDHIVALGPFHVDVGWFARTGDARLIESTRRDAVPGSRLSLVDDDLAIAAQIRFRRDSLVRHLTAFLAQAPIEAIRQVASGHHQTVLNEARTKGAIWHTDGSAVSMPVGTVPGLAIRIEAWRISRRRLEQLRDLVAGIVPAESGAGGLADV
jgi:hypothetical protein